MSSCNCDAYLGGGTSSVVRRTKGFPSTTRGIHEEPCTASFELRFFWLYICSYLNKNVGTTERYECSLVR